MKRLLLGLLCISSLGICFGGTGDILISYPTVTTSSGIAMSYLRGNYYTYAQTFQTGVNIEVYSIKLRMYRTLELVDLLELYITETDSNQPDLTNKLGSGDYDVSTITTDTNGLFYQINLNSSVNLTADVLYSFVTIYTGTTTNYLNFIYDAYPTVGYTGGKARYSSNSGSTWADGNGDFVFEILGSGGVTPTESTQDPIFLLGINF